MKKVLEAWARSTSRFWENSFTKFLYFSTIHCTYTSYRCDGGSRDYISIPESGTNNLVTFNLFGLHSKSAQRPWLRRARSEQGHQQQVLRTLAQLSLKGEALIGGGEWHDGGELLLLLIIIIQSWEGCVSKSIFSACPIKECILRDFWFQPPPHARRRQKIARHFTCFWNTKR